MANPEHVKWFLEGVDAWNKRREEVDFKPDLSGEDLRALFERAGLLGVDRRMPLLKADLSRAVLQNTVLRGADLRYANLSSAILQEAELTGADLREADLSGADLSWAYLREADLSKASLHETTLLGAFLKSTHFLGADLRGLDVTSFVGSGFNRKAGRRPEYTDLSTTTDLTQDQLDTMKGDSGTILPDHLTRPAHWPDLQDTRGPDEGLPDSTQTALALASPVVDVYWTDGALSASILLSAKEPQPRRYHPPTAEGASMDLLASMGAMADQIANALQQDTRINARNLIGDLAALFDAIRAEVQKDEGLVLSFVIDTNLRAIETLHATHAEALREVDSALVTAFVQLGRTWRKASNILKEIEDPTQSDLVPPERLDEIETLENRMIEVITDPENATLIHPTLAGVTRDMAAYPWDKEDPKRHRLMRAAAFGVLAHRIKTTLQSPPSNSLNRTGIYATLLGLVLAIVALF